MAVGVDNTEPPLFRIYFLSAARICWGLSKGGDSDGPCYWGAMEIAGLASEPVFASLLAAVPAGPVCARLFADPASAPSCASLADCPLLTESLSPRNT